MSVNGIRDAIKLALAGITSLKETYDNAPESIGATPAAFVVVVRGRYHDDFSGQMSHDFEITVLVSQGKGLAAAQNELDAYLAESGTDSIRAAVEAAALTTHGDTITMTGYRDYGGIMYNGTPYIGCRFDVTVCT